MQGWLNLIACVSSFAAVVVFGYWKTGRTKKE
jgi:hypothetical protein